MSKIWSLKEIEPSYDKTVFSSNIGQDMCNKVDKSSQIKQDKNSLTSTLA